jgi:hypothetical protein
MRFDALRTVLAISAVKDWDLRQIDIKGAYLNGELKEELYMRQPTGFDDGSGRDCRPRKSIYGLRSDYCAYIHEETEMLSPGDHLGRLYNRCHK